MKAKYWLVLGAVTAGTALTPACSSQFSSCTASRSCPASGSSGTDASGAGEAGESNRGSDSAGAAGLSGQATAGADTAGAAGESDQGPSGDLAGSAGEGGAVQTLVCDEPLSACGSSCVDLTTDTKNCGRCGHDCLGGACRLSTCEPVELARDQGPIQSVAVDDRYVYWGGDGTVGRTRIDGSGETKLFAASTTSSSGEVAYNLVVTKTALYWANGWQGLGVRECLLPDCGEGPKTLTSAGVNQYPLAYDAKSDTLFWAQTDGMWRKHSGDAASRFFALATKDPLYNLVADGTFVYWTEAFDTTKFAIYKNPINSAAISPVAINLPYVESIAAYGNALYFTGREGIWSIPLPNGVGDTPPHLVAVESAAARGIVGDSSGVYWTSRVAGAESIKRCRVAGCGDSPEVLAATGPSWGITTDAKAVYWVTDKGQVMKVAK